ncbi:MAG: peptidoglycan-binding protein, partial [Vicinamibacterales bacterium]
MLGVAITMAALTLAARPVQAAIISDIILIVDESGSMGDVQTNLRTNIGTFAAILAAGGVDAR